MYYGHLYGGSLKVETKSKGREDSIPVTTRNHLVNIDDSLLEYARRMAGHCGQAFVMYIQFIFSRPSLTRLARLLALTICAHDTLAHSCVFVPVIRSTMLAACVGSESEVDQKCRPHLRATLC